MATAPPSKSSCARSAACGRFRFTRNSLVPPGLRGCRLSLLEVSGSLGDLGTFIPLLVGMANQGSIDFASALFWAGAFNVLTGAAWDVPMCVQPMKTIAAVALAEGLSRVQVAAAGIMTSTIVLALGLTRSILIVSNVIPISVVRGMQLGLGLSLLRRGLGLITATGGWLPPSSGVAHGGVSFDCYLTGAIGFASVLLMLQHERLPAAPPLLRRPRPRHRHRRHRRRRRRRRRDGNFTDGGAGAIGVDYTPSIPVFWALDGLTAADATHALVAAALPQLPLTTLNSVVSVCTLAHDLFPARSVPSQTSVATSVGLMNCVGCLFGAMPCCHGAGGLAAQHRFGARRGASMLFLGFTKLLLSIFLGQLVSSLLNHFPASVLGVLLGFSGLELAKAGRHLQSANELTVGYLTAGATLALNTGAGCAIGLLAALACGGAQRVDARPPAALGGVVLRGVWAPLPPAEPAAEAAEAEAEAAEEEAAAPAAV